MTAHRNGAHGCRADEAEGAFTAHHEVAQDVDRIIEVEEGVDRIAHGVLQAEESLDGSDGLGVASDSITQPNQATVDLGLGAEQLRTGVDRTGIQDRPTRQHHDHGFKGAVGVRGRAAEHAG